MTKRTTALFKQMFLNKLKSLYAIEEIEALYKIVVEEVFEQSYVFVKLEENNETSALQWSRLEEFLKRLATSEPIQHIVGKAAFYGEDYYVNSNTLVPRQETEELVDFLIAKYSKSQKLNILDIGTGTGCIAITLAKNILGSIVTAIDVSEQALELARRNAAKHKVEINFIQENILSPIGSYNKNYSLIVSNPPYVRNSEKSLMHANVIDYDPHLALFVDDDDPLIFYRTITQFAADNLKTEGMLAFEINEAFGVETAELLKKQNFNSVDIIKDINGKNRFVTGIK